MRGEHNASATSQGISESMGSGAKLPTSNPLDSEETSHTANLSVSQTMSALADASCAHNMQDLRSCVFRGAPMIIQTSNCNTILELVDTLRLKPRPKVAHDSSATVAQRLPIIRKLRHHVCGSGARGIIEKRQQKGYARGGEQTSTYRGKAARALDSNFEPIAREIALRRLRNDEKEM